MSLRLDIVHIMWKGEIGGAERAVYQLVTQQMKDPTLAPALLFAQSGGLYWDKAQTLGCPIICLHLPNGHALTHIPAIHTAIRPYKIHHFHSSELLIMLSSLMCRDARRIYTHRGGIIRYSAKKRIVQKMSGFFLRHCFHAFSGNTEHAARCGAELYKIPIHRFKITYNGLEFDHLLPQRSPEIIRGELSLNPTDFVIGTSANLRPWKRIDRLLNAVTALPKPNIKLLIIGDGVDRSRLQELTNYLGIGQKVIFTGMKDHIADYLQVMDVFCLPSMGLESFGNAAVEAMAFGLPTVVFSDGGGMLEHIQGGETGFVVNGQSELVKIFEELAGNREWGRQIGNRARTHIRQKYTLEEAGRAYKSLYDSVL
jgi:glycosyltransferase involved in cell wall biosynthesis